MDISLDRVNYDVKNYANNIEEIKKYNAKLSRKNRE